MTTWMDPEGIMLSEISQPEKDKYHIWNIRKNPNEQSEKRDKLKNRLNYREQNGWLPE